MPYKDKEKAKEAVQRSREKYRADYNTTARKGRLAKYNLTPEDYDAMVQAQLGVCALCDSPPRGGRWNRLYVDHNHETGEVRGLLCNSCNVSLGLYEKPSWWRVRADHYLNFSSTRIFVKERYRNGR